MTRRILCKVLLAVVVVLGLLFFSQALFAQGRSEEALEHAKKVQEKHTDTLMARRGVVGTAVGLNDDGDYAVLVLLELPGSARIPSHLQNVPVCPVVTGKFYALADPTAWFPRPVPTGVSTGHPAITAGTIGCRVTDGTYVYALSNNHVYANENQANIGDAVIQPGTYDGGKDPDKDDADVIGWLYDYAEIDFAGGNNTIDAAIASTTTDLVGTGTPSDGYGVPNSETVGPALRMPVQKYGRTTGLTSAKIGGINTTVNVGYDSGTARFVGQILIRGGGFSAGGDSGSLIVTADENRNPVGLLFAGSSSSTIANPIDLVLGHFGVTVDNSPGGPQPPVANAGPDQTVTDEDEDGQETVTLDGSASYDPDGSITAYLWQEGTTTLGSDAIITVSFDVAGSPHTVTLTVTDNDGMTDTDDVIITVKEPTGEVSVTGIDPDTMQAGTSTTVTITGSGFDDDVGASVSVTFENGSGPAPTASSVNVVDSGTITAEVTAKSGGPPKNRIWDVRVTNPDGSTGVLVGGFTVTP